MSQTTQSTPDQSSYRARWASIAIRSNLAEIQQGIPSLVGRIPSLPNDISRHKLVPVKNTLYHGSDAGRPLKVGIIGAGCAGLFTALIFDNLKKTCGLEVDYEILESNSEERLGGRLFSYYFKDVQNPGVHDYYDVGAMRFPEIDIMKRTFDLFEKICGMRKTYEGSTPERGDLIPYFLDGNNTPLLYNGVQVVPKRTDKPSGETFGITGVPQKYLNKTPGSLIDEVIKPFTERLVKDPVEGWKALMDFGDKYSVRQYLQEKYDYDTIEWLETFSYGNRWYDQALSEMVLESLDFNHKKNWWCVEGGAQEAAHRMHRKLERKNCISYQKKVAGMTWVKDKDKIQGVDVSIKGETPPRRYDAIFNSAPLGSMQRMDLSGLNLNWGTKQAIRSLGYGASCKVAIRFKNLWWIKHFGINKGGVAKTDLPLRVCVYPSYNRHDGAEKPGVLLCSYTWSQEAQRVASLINRKSPHDEEELKTLLIDNLAKLHSKTNDHEDYSRVHQIISEAYETHHAYDWYADPGTTGAFAYFGPSQFRNMYPWITRSNGKHMIIGEAASAHHAWVVGALESAVRGVYQFLFAHSKDSKAAHEALQLYNRGEVESPYGPLPAEYDRMEDVKLMSTEGQAAVNTGEGAALAFEGEWAREQVVFESIRLEQGGDRLDAKMVEEAEIAALIEVAAPA